MRVIAGTARRLQLKTLEGMDTRPTTDRLKETLFNMIQNDLYGSCFLDLFSGSGGIGIEALSRGAQAAYFVENNKKAAACIQENLNHTKLQDKGKVMTMDALSSITMLEDKGIVFDFIFMDPPYGKELEKEVFFRLKDSSIASDDTVIMLETDLRADFSYLKDTGFIVTKEKRYKTNQHVFISR